MSDLTEKGQAINWGWIQVGRDRSIGYTSNVDENDVVRCLHADALRELPDGARYELRKMSALNFGRTKGMAWYHASTFAQDAGWGKAPPGWQPEGGYYLVGQFTVPERALNVETAPVIGDKHA